MMNGETRQIVKTLLPIVPPCAMLNGYLAQRFEQIRKILEEQKAKQ